MADNKDLKDENPDVESVVESEKTEDEDTVDSEETVSTEDTVESDTEAADESETSEETPDASEEDDATESSGDTTQAGITAAEEASREAFSSGQVTAETIAADKHDLDKNANNESDEDPIDGEVDGMAAFFDHPDELMQAAAFTRLAKYTKYDAFSPFPIHGMDHAMGLGPSWIPWVTFGAGSAGFLLANALQFGMMTFDWPMIVGGKSFAPWPAFIPIMFELTVLLAGVTTVIVMLIAAGCFRKPRIIDPDITNDRFVLWISAEDETFDIEQVKAFMESLDPVEVRTITKGA